MRSMTEAPHGHWIDVVDAIGEILFAAAGSTVRRVARVVGTTHRARRRRRMMGELQVMSDHMLKDIGVPRAMIPYLVDRRLAGVDER